MLIWFYDVYITFFSCRWQWVLQYEEKASQAKEVEEGLLEEEEVAGVTLVNLMEVAAVVAAVVAIGKPQVEFGMMAMTSVSSAKQGALPGHYVLWMFKYETVSFPNCGTTDGTEKGGKMTILVMLTALILKPSILLCNLFWRHNGK